MYWDPLLSRYHEVRILLSLPLVLYVREMKTCHRVCALASSSGDRTRNEDERCLFKDSLYN